MYVKLLKKINTFFDYDFIGNYVDMDSVSEKMKNVKMHGGY